MPIGPLDELDVDAWERMVDVNIKGVLFGIAAALPVFREQGGGHFVTTASTAAYKVVPNQAVYAGTKAAVRMICEGLRQEADGTVRVTTISPGFVHTDSPSHVSSPAVREQIREARDRMAIPPDAIARAIAFAIEQPAERRRQRDHRPAHRADLGADGLALVEHARGEPADQGERDDPHEAEPAVVRRGPCRTAARGASR